MYIWIGCKLPQDFEDSIRSQCLALNKEIGLDAAAFSLPQHISLKISFPVEDSRGKTIIESLSGLLGTEEPFCVNPRSIEKFRNILWVTFAESPELRRLHDLLDSELQTRFGIPQHMLDKSFLFHSTLFMDSRHKNISQMAEALTSFPLPRQLHVNTFLLGTSPNGIPGSYRVVREIPL